MCSMQNSETEPVKYRELLHMEAHFRMCDYLTRNGVVYNAGIWRPHRKCGLASGARTGSAVSATWRWRHWSITSD